jgi:hypothetical protein
MLIKCPECNKEISSDAISCPTCGYPLKKTGAAPFPRPTHRTNKRFWLWSIIALIVIIIGFKVAQEIKNNSRQNSKSESAIKEEVTLKPPSKYKWEEVFRQGYVFHIYLEPKAYEDNEFLSEMVRYYTRDGIINVPGYKNKRAVRILFFDKRDQSPIFLQMTDKEILQWRAVYNYNPANGFEEFAFIKITNSKASPPDWQEIPTKISRFNKK